MALNFFPVAQGVEYILVTFFVLSYFAIQAWCKFLSTFPLSAHRKLPAAAEAVTHEGTPVPMSACVGLACPLPADICGRIAVNCGFQGVGVLSACSKNLQGQVWESREVWLALSTAFRLPSAGLAADSACLSYAGREAREAFRRAAFRTDLSRLRVLATKGRPQAILEEAAQVACGLLPGDLPHSALADFIQIGSRCLGAHDPESPTAISAAERLLRAARRCVELFTEEQLEHLEYAYKSVHQLHALMLSSMQDSYEDILKQSFWCDPTISAEGQEFKDFFDLCGSGDSLRTAPP